VSDSNAAKPWADPQHPGNRIRPTVRCAGCGAKGFITAWGPWCFACNQPRMTRLSAAFDKLAEDLRKIGYGV
jgi:hypothetical protein